MSHQEEDVVLKVLHTADWHLGKRFNSFDAEDGHKLARARLDAVARLLLLADQHVVDAMLCAGDLFDQPDPPADVVDPLIELFRKKERSFPVFLLPGNHDPLTTTSIYRADGPLKARLPSYVRIVDRDDFMHPLGKEGVLYAVPCRSQSGQSDPTEKIPQREPGDERIRIGMVHGQTFHFKGYQTTFPIAIDAAKRRGLDYLALGDTHAHRNVAENGPPMIYPSSPEPGTFGETEAGFAALVLFHRRPRAPSVLKERVAQWRWRQETCKSVDAVRDLMREPNLQKTVLRLTLDLKGTVRELDELETILREMKGTNVSHGRVAVLQLQRDRTEVDLANVEDAVAGMPEVLRTVVDRLRQQEGELSARAIRHLYKVMKELR